MDGKVEPSKQEEAIYIDLHHQVVSILSDILQVDLDPMVGDISRRELDTWDSVNHLRFVLELEEIFQITLSDEEISELMTLRQVEALLAQHGVGLLRMDE